MFIRIYKTSGLSDYVVVTSVENDFVMNKLESPSEAINGASSRSPHLSVPTH